jgi:quinol-cytochrome oxidoreductase complex cytochrome b subunit
VPAGEPPAAGEPLGVALPAPALEKTAEGPFALRQLIRDYIIPVETNNIWYALGGVLALALVLEVLTGLVLSLLYTPDAAKAFGITTDLIQSAPWAVIINLHYWNAFLIFGLIIAHMMRVFISGGYKHGKQGLWGVGVILAVLAFALSLTGEALHWDEVGFGVPWNISEFLNALGLAGAFNYTTDALLTLPVATEKLSQLYAVHIAIVPLALLLFVGLHYYLVRVKGISMPFWLRPSGRKAPFTDHIKIWLIYGGAAMLILLLIALFVHRDPGTAPQLLSSSPLFNSPDDPGGLGYTPSFPISWTRGMNIIVANMGLDPDIWGTVIGMVLMFGALLVIPFLDRGDREPQGWAAAFSLRKRGWAFLAMAIFWVVLVFGMIASAITGAG